MTEDDHVRTSHQIGAYTFQIDYHEASKEAVYLVTFPEQNDLDAGASQMVHHLERTVSLPRETWLDMLAAGKAETAAYQVKLLQSGGDLHEVLVDLVVCLTTAENTNLADVIAAAVGS